jgi:hypothetical protein
VLNYFQYKWSLRLSINYRRLISVCDALVARYLRTRWPLQITAYNTLYGYLAEVRGGREAVLHEASCTPLSIFRFLLTITQLRLVDTLRPGFFSYITNNFKWKVERMHTCFRKQWRFYPAYINVKFRRWTVGIRKEVTFLSEVFETCWWGNESGKQRSVHWGWWYLFPRRVCQCRECSDIQTVQG